MHVYLYVTLTIVLGMGVACVVGRMAARMHGAAATILFLAASIGLGIFLAFPVLLGAAALCSWVGITETQCINTNDQTVWFLAAPLVFFPVYAVCMFVSRAVGGPGITSRPHRIVIAALLFVPVALFVFPLLVTNTDGIALGLAQRSERAARLRELCDTAVRIDVRRTTERARSVYFTILTPATFPLLQDLDFVEIGRGTDRSGAPVYERARRKPDGPLYVNGVVNAFFQRISEPEAEYEIAGRLLESKADAAKHLFALETTIRDRRTNEVLAVFTSAGERHTAPGLTGPKFCPSGFDRDEYEREVVSYVLGLLDPKAAARAAERLKRVSARAAASR